MDIFYYADLYAIGLLIIFTTVFVIKNWRRGRGRRFTSAMAYFFGTFVTVGLMFHNAEMIWRIIPGTTISHGTKPVYDFRFYSLLLFGTVMVIQGIAVMKAAQKFALGEEAARSTLIRRTLIVLALSAPLIPVHPFGTLTTIIALLALSAVLPFKKAVRFIFAPRQQGFGDTKLSAKNIS